MPYPNRRVRGAFAVADHTSCIEMGPPKEPTTSQSDRPIELARVLRRAARLREQVNGNAEIAAPMNSNEIVIA